MNDDKKQTILILDDEPTFVSQISLFLESRGFRVLGAADAAAADRILRHENIAVVLADQRMPGVKGVEFLERVRNDFPEVVRVLITGYSDIGAVIDGVNRGSIYRYIPKKLIPDEIALVVRQCLEKYQQDREMRRLTRANRRLLRRLAAEENLSAMGIFGKEMAKRLEEMILGLSGYLFQEAGKGDRIRLARDFQLLDYSLRRIGGLSSVAGQGGSGGGRPVSLNAVMEKEMMTLEKRAREARQAVLFATELDPAIPPVPGEEAGFRHLFKELLENAVLFSPQDSKEVTVRSRFIPEKDDSRVEIRISNDRSGDPTGDPSQFFVPFYTSLGRVETFEGPVSLPEDYNLGPHFHFGIGLPLAKWITSRHGGELTLEGEGNRLTASIILPFPGEPR